MSVELEKPNVEPGSIPTEGRRKKMSKINGAQSKKAPANPRTGFSKEIEETEKTGGEREVFTIGWKNYGSVRLETPT